MSRKHKRKVRTFGPFGSLLFIPLLLVGGLLSIPYTALKRAQWRRRERDTLRAMMAKHRVMEWEEFVEKISSGQGTVIVEHLSSKGGTLWWWTLEDIWAVCPFEAAFTDLLPDVEHRPFYEWCYKTYTNRDDGTALLVAGSWEQRKGSLKDGVQVVTMWLSMVGLRQSSGRQWL
jgi:hypothetical protein